MSAFFPGKDCPLCKDKMWRKESSVEVDFKDMKGLRWVHQKCYFKLNEKRIKKEKT